MSDELRFGFIGAGETAVRMAKGIASSGNAKLTWVSDVKEELASDLAQRHGAQWTTSIETMLKQPDVDAVYMALPHFLYVPMSEKATAAGKHLLLEKPMGSSLAEAKQVATLCQAAGVALGVSFPRRYAAPTVKQKEVIRTGVLGRIQDIHITLTVDKPETYWQGGYSGRNKDNWRTSKAKSGGGVMMINCIHDLDAIYYATGLEPERVYAEYDTYATETEVEDSIHAVIRYKGGTIGVVNAGTAMPGGAGPAGNGGTRIAGTAGQLALVDWKLYLYTEMENVEYAPLKWHEVALPKLEDGFTSLVRDYSAAVLRGETPPTSGIDCLRAISIVDSAYTSLKQGRPIECNWKY